MPRKRKRKRLDGPIHSRILRLREERGLTQERLAEAVGVDKTAVSHWETGLSRPDISRLQSLAGALGVSMIELVRGEQAFAAIEAAVMAASPPAAA